MSDDPYTVIRNEVAALLQLDVDHLTVRERLRLDLFSSARFEFDAAIARLRAGGQVDPARLAEVVDMLDRMIDRYVPASSDEKVNQLGSNASRRKLEAKIAARIAAEEAEAGERVERRDEEMEAKDAEIASLKAQLEEARNAAPVALSPSDDQTKPPPQTSSQPPLPHKDAPIPQSYLKRENPWDPHVSGLNSDPGWMHADRWGPVGTRR